MAVSRSLVVLVALLALAVIAAVSADDAGSSITNPIAQSPVEDYEGSDTPVDSAIDDAAEAPDAGSLGGPAAPAGSGDPSTDPSTNSLTEKTPASASTTVGMAGIAFAATGALVGYLAL